MNSKFIFSGKGVDLTESIKSYFLDKVKRVRYIELALVVDLEVGENISHKGVATDFYIRVLITLPKTLLRIKKVGEDVYKLIDEMVDNLEEKLKKYKDNLRKWEGSEPWPVRRIIEDADYKLDNDGNYSNYLTPVRRKYVEHTIPISVEEAIQRMELLGKEFFFFRNVEDNEYAVIYKENSGYVLLSPKK
mgnify:CR=1 FL=1